MAIFKLHLSNYIILYISWNLKYLIYQLKFDGMPIAIANSMPNVYGTQIAFASPMPNKSILNPTYGTHLARLSWFRTQCVPHDSFLFMG